MIPRVTDELGTVSTLDDRPNDTSGLTAAELKAKFDADSGTLKAYLNDVLIPFLEGTAAAASLGITTIPGFSAGDVQTALEQIVQAMQDVTQGSVTDGSITLAKLAAEVTAVALGGAAASHTHGAGDVSSGVLDEARLPVLDGTKLGAGSVGTAQLGAAVVTTEKLAALSVLATHIALGAVTAQKIAPGAVTAEKIADDAVKLTFTNTTVAAAAFAPDTTYADFPFRATVSLAGVTGAMVPEVVFGATDAASGIFAPVAESISGGVYLYASEVPSANITIPTIICWR